MSSKVLYEVECQLDPDIVAEYDAWLPDHVRQVLACAGFEGATIDVPESRHGERQRRRIRYRVESAAALDQYLENEATRLRTETASRFGGRVHCERRVFRHQEELTAPAAEPPRCLNCGSPVAERHCPQCGQAGDVHVLSMQEVAGDVAHSLLHLDSRVWRTLKLLIRKPGELTREFIAGRHQAYLPPFRLYLGISILYFALLAILPDKDVVTADVTGEKVVVPVTVLTPEGKFTDELRKELEAEGVDPKRITEYESKRQQGNTCNLDISLPWLGSIREPFKEACLKVRADGGKRLAERFAATAPKLMFAFLPLMAAVALLFYWRPRRLYAEHLVLFLHNHAFTFLALALLDVFNSLQSLTPPFAGIFGFFMFLLLLWLPYYVYRSMRVVYGQGRLATSLKFIALFLIYFVLLGITMFIGLVWAAMT